MKCLLRPGLLSLLLLAGSTSGACRTKALPGLMPYDGELPEVPEPAFDSPEATVVRHSDPVAVRRPGAIDAFPLTFYRKKERLGVGGVVECGGGGTAELVWPGSVTTVIVANESVLELGDPELNEPLFRFRSLAYVRMVLAPGSRAGLPGGAEIMGDPAEGTGPLILKRLHPRVVRLANASQHTAFIHYREAVLEVGAGEAVDLPLLEDSAPRPIDPATTTLASAGINFSVVGRVGVNPTESGRGAHLRALDPVRLKALGVRVDLPAGGQAVFSSLSRRGPERGATPTDATEPSHTTDDAAEEPLR